MLKSVFILFLVLTFSNGTYADWMMLEPCKDDEFRTHGSICTPCSTTDKGYVGSDPEECSKCKDVNGKPTRRLINDWCVTNDCGEGKFQVFDGSCISCSNTKEFGFTTPKECSKCKDDKGNSIREMSGSSCILSDCGDGNLHDIWGNCVSCLTSESVTVNVRECARCENRYVGEDGSCRPCSDDTYPQISAENCRMSNDRYLATPDGGGTYYSYSCSIPYAYETSVEKCAQCKDFSGKSTRKMFEYNGIKFCGLIDCAPNQFRDVDGSCMPK